MKYYIKIITGLREDQCSIIPMQEAHKAYYLFNNPTERGTFDNGIALIGSSIREIQPAWNETMGWSPTHTLDSYDYRHMNNEGITQKMYQLLEKAKNTAKMATEDKDLLNKRLSECILLLEDNDGPKQLHD